MAVPAGARASWCPISGEHRGAYNGLLVGASSVLSPAEAEAISPFDLAHGVPPDRVDLYNATFEQFRVQRKYARPLAQQGFAQLERSACLQYVPGQARNLKVNVRIEELTSEPVLLPVWVMAYRYQNQVFRFLINGQTGKSTGQAPTDWKKVVLVAGLVLAAILLAWLWLRTERPARNAVSWLDWNLPEAGRDMLRFTREAIALRRRHPCLTTNRFFVGQPLPGRDIPDIAWHGVALAQPPWQAGDGRLLRFTVAGMDDAEEDLHGILNRSDRAADVELPVIPGRRWHLAMDTARAAPADIVPRERQRPHRTPVYRATAHSVVVLEARG